MSLQKPESPRQLFWVLMIFLSSALVSAAGLGLVSYAVSYGVSAGISSGVGETCEVKDVL